MGLNARSRIKTLADFMNVICLITCKQGYGYLRGAGKCVKQVSKNTSPSNVQSDSYLTRHTGPPQKRDKATMNRKEKV